MSKTIYLWPLATLPMLAPAVHAQSVHLRWDPPDDGAQLTYIVERGTSAGVYTVSAPVAPGRTDHEAAGLVAGVTYFFVVRAVDSAGQRSPASNEVSVLLPLSSEPVPSEPVPSEPVPSPAPAPAPTASPLVTTVSVTTEGALQQAAALVRSSTIISIAPGTYRLTRPLTLTGSLQDVELRSSTGNAADVILIGPPASTTTPLPSSIVATATERLTLSYLTIMYTPGYAITLGNGVQQPRLRGLRIIGNGRFVQSPLHASGLGAAGGVVENCWFEYVGSATGLPSALDIRGGQDWNVRGNHFVDPAPGTQVTFGPAVHAWQGSARTVVERNTFVNTTREIVFGLGNRTPDQHTGGTIRNNMVARRAGTGARGAAISLLDAPEAVVIHNTMLLAGTSKLAIDYDASASRNAVIANNLVDGTTAAKELGQALVASNVTRAAASWFVNAATGDLRLHPNVMRLDGSSTVAPLVVDAAWTLYTTAVDHGGQARPSGPASDVGADELTP